MLHSVVQPRLGFPVVRLAGDMRLRDQQESFDQVCSTLLGLICSGECRIVLNLTRVEGIDSQGISFIVRFHAETIIQKGGLYLVVTHGPVVRCLSQLNLIGVCLIFPDEASALAAAAAGL